MTCFGMTFSRVQVLKFYFQVSLLARRAWETICDAWDPTYVDCNQGKYPTSIMSPQILQVTFEFRACRPTQKFIARKQAKSLFLEVSHCLLPLVGHRKMVLRCTKNGFRGVLESQDPISKRIGQINNWFNKQPH